ncbi:MAG: hypothetical protein ACLPQY_30715 [Streptosporangiaceae bacterium]
MTAPLAAGPPDSAVIDGINVDAVAAAVRACPGVSGLDRGQFSPVASYLPGRIVGGVEVSGGRVTVQIRARWAVPVPELAARITRVLAPLIRDRPVDVVISDIDDPPAAPLAGPARRASRAAPSPGLPPA